MAAVSCGSLPGWLHQTRNRLGRQLPSRDNKLRKPEINQAALSMCLIAIEIANSGQQGEPHLTVSTRPNGPPDLPGGLSVQKSAGTRSTRPMDGARWTVQMEMPRRPRRIRAPHFPTTHERPRVATTCRCSPCVRVRHSLPNFTLHRFFLSSILLSLHPGHHSPIPDSQQQPPHPPRPRPRIPHSLTNSPSAGQGIKTKRGGVTLSDTVHPGQVMPVLSQFLT
jgi:hypothetical protein